MNSTTVLFVVHNKAQCGIYEFGQNVFAVLAQSQRYKFVKVECSRLSDLTEAINQYAPSAIIYNYHPNHNK